MSKKFWKKLPDDLKPKIIQAMNEATEVNRKLAAELEAEYLANIKAYADKSGNLKILTLTADQKDAWRKATAVVYPDFYKVIGEDLIKKAQK
jgi:C4-dicarboxylate-binding protein DctP